MASGILGQIVGTGSEADVYTVPSSTLSVVNVSIINNDGSNDETATMPTEEEVNAKIAEITVPDWKVNREKEYPLLQDCIHALLDGGDTLTDLQAARQAVKDKYPKG